MTGIEERRTRWRFLGDSVSVRRRAVLAVFFGFAARAALGGRRCRGTARRCRAYAAGQR